jgi:hypothetical protein
MAGIDGVGRVGIRSYVAPTTSLSSIVANGLVLNLDAGNVVSYPGTGTVWTDLSGNGNNATLINGTSYSSVSGGALVFDGINDYSSQQIIPFTPSFTIFMWVYPISGTGIMTYGESGRAIMALDYNTSGNLRIYTNNYYETFNSALTLNSWNLISVVASESSSTREVFVNGISKGVNSWSVVTQPAIFKLGVQSFSGYGNCRIAQALIYNRDLSSTEVLQNFNSTKSRFGFASYTTRTSAFAAATGITDATILNALNTFDTGLISNGLDTKMKALYPFVGGTANTHKYNFMDARDVDAAFRLQFNGGWVHSSTGVKGNGTNTFADTYLNASTNLNPASTAFSIYKRLNETTNECYLSVGPITSQFNSPSELFYWNGSTYFMCSGSSEKSSTSINKGFYMVNRDSNTLKLFKNTSSTSYSDNYTSHYNANVIIGGIGGYFTNNELSFSHIGSGLSDSEETIFYTLVHAFQTSLSRAV